jgi:hypothetical protein
MTSEVVVAIFSLIGTLIGSISGIIISNKLVNYRLQQLEAKVDKHNHVIERMTVLEHDAKFMRRDIDEIKEGIQ